MLLKKNSDGILMNRHKSCSNKCRYWNREGKACEICGLNRREITRIHGETCFEEWLLVPRQIGRPVQTWEIKQKCYNNGIRTYTHWEQERIKNMKVKE